MKAIAALLLAAALPALAQNLEARRYRTSEGVEVLTSRPTPAPAAPAAALVAPPAPAAMQALAASEARRVTPPTQASRDRERYAILNAELVTEAKALASKRQALASPRVNLDLTSEQLQALRASVAAHEDNIRALNREIRRMPASAMADAAGASMQKASLNRLDDR